MEGPGLDRLMDVEAPQPSPQLTSGISGERERHDVSRLGVPLFDAIGDPPGEDRCLARTGGSNDRKWGRVDLDRAALVGVEPNQQTILAHDRHDTSGLSDLLLSIRSHYSRVMTFPKKNLNANETIALDMRPHWWYFAEAAASLLGSIILGIVVMAKAEDGSNVKKGLTWLTIILLVVTSVWLVSRYLKWLTTDFVITSNRLIFRQGLIAKHGIEIPLERVNNVNFSQGVFERMLGAGDLLIESGGEDGQQRFTDIRRPATGPEPHPCPDGRALPATSRLFRAGQHR